MANGGFYQKGHGSRFPKPYDTSNSFVKRVANRVGLTNVAGYLGRFFSSNNEEEDIERTEPPIVSRIEDNDRTETTSMPSLQSYNLNMDKRAGDIIDNIPAKRSKLVNSNTVFELDNCSIPSTSGMYQNRNYDKRNYDFMDAIPGTSGMQSKKFTSKEQGACIDDNSDSSESTSGCSSLVPQSDKFSQSAFINSSKRKTLEDKLSYARRLKHSRSLIVEQSVPRLGDSTSSSRKHEFDMTVYGAPIIDKSSVREKMISSPFYSGQTSYGGLAAYRRARSRSSISSHDLSRSLNISDRRNSSLQMRVKPADHSYEDSPNISQTAKKILEAIEEFSTPIKDAKRIPIDPPLSSKRKRMEYQSVGLSTPISPLNRKAGPSTRGLDVPTVPDLIKLKRMERLQESTAAARLVSVEKIDVTMIPKPQVTDNKNIVAKSSGKIVTKLKDRKKEIQMEIAPKLDLPQVKLPITSLPNFDLSILVPAPTPAPAVKPVVETVVKPVEKEKMFNFSEPISISKISSCDGLNTPVKVKFTLSMPLTATQVDKKISRFNNGNKLVNLINNNKFENLSSEALSKLKKKTSSPNKLKSGSVLDVLSVNKKNDAGDCERKFDPGNETWECVSCMVRNVSGNKLCRACSAARTTINSLNKLDNTNTSHKSSGSNKESELKCTSCLTPKLQPETETIGFGDKFKPKPGTWTCKECYVTNADTCVKCQACETPKPGTEPVKPIPSNFGDMFKPKPGSWSCKECFVTNKEGSDKCAACEAPKPGTTLKKQEPDVGFGNMFKPKPGSWSCKECLISNNETAVKCQACETPKPGASVEVSQPAVEGFGDVFKKKSDQWACPTCMVNNNVAVEKCVACETSKPGGKTGDKKQSEVKFTFGLPAGNSLPFKFGVDKADEKNVEGQKPNAGLSFGFGTAVAATTSGTTPVQPTFSFGIPKDDNNVGTTTPASSKLDNVERVEKSGENETKPMFLFGGQKTTGGAPPVNLTFGQVSSSNCESKKTEPSSLFNFKSAELSNNVQKSKSQTGMFSFGKTTNDTSVTSTGGFATAPPKQECNEGGFTFTNDVTKYGTKPKIDGVFGGFRSQTTTPSFTQTNLFGTSTTVSTTTAFSMSNSTSSSLFNNNNSAKSGFGAPAASQQQVLTSSVTPLSPFSSTGTSSGTPATPFMFGGNNTNKLSFGAAAPSSFSSTTNDKPFVFGANSTTPTAGVFAFSGTKQADSGSSSGGGFGVGSFGQSKPQGGGFSFGSAAPSAQFNSFTGATTAKLPEPAPQFGVSVQQVQPQQQQQSFGLNSAPATFGSQSSTPGFNTTPSTFLFPGNSTQSQPATPSGFSLSVPTTFNFTQSKPPTAFTAEPVPGRKVIKAHRRTTPR